MTTRTRPPLAPLLLGLPRGAIRRTAGRLAARGGASLRHPLAGLVALSLATWGWHVPAAFELALRSRGWHEAEHASFVAAGLLFWWPVRAGTLGRLCDALGLELVVGPGAGSAAFQTLPAREQDRRRRLERRLGHARLAARLLAIRRSQARSLVAKARAVVDRWEREGLCSSHYISRWRAMLAGPAPRVAQALLEPGDWADALFQNTPWGFALPPLAA